MTITTNIYWDDALYHRRNGLTFRRDAIPIFMEPKSWNTSRYVTLEKVKQSLYRPEQAQRVERGTALPFLDLGARRGWAVRTTPRPLYPRERPATHCTGG
jgi:hypothetical protein